MNSILTLQEITFFQKNYFQINKFLQKMFFSKKIPHAFIFTGNHQNHLLLISKFFIYSLIKQKLITQKDVEFLNDFAFMPSIEFLDGNKASIKNMDVKELMKNFIQTPIEKDAPKIALLHLVENATSSALNSLLKFLENPPSKTYFLLTTHNQNKILKTITSRCIVLKIPNAVTELNLNSENLEEDINQKCIKLFELISENKEYLFFFENLIANKKNANKIFKILQLLLKDYWRIKNHQPLMFPSIKNIFLKLEAQNYSFEKTWEAIEKAKQYLKKNVIYKLTLINLALELGN